MLFAYISICVELWKIPIIRKEYSSTDNGDVVSTKMYLLHITSSLPYSYIIY